MKFGDIISLYCGDHARGYVSVDPCFEAVGFTHSDDDDLAYSHLSNALFQVCPMLSYDNKASKAKLARRGSFSSQEAMLIDMRIAMEEAKNLRQMRSMLEPSSDRSGLVLYGMAVQLKHLKTGKYLNGENFTALKEKDCLRLSLSPGSMTCSFKILPRFKVRHEGSEIYYRDQLFLYNAKIHDYGIHASTKPLDPLQPKPIISECNLSVAPSSFRVEKFSRFSAAQRRNLLFESMDLVRFSHAETDSLLSASCCPSKRSKPPYLRKNVEGLSHEMSVKSMWVVEGLENDSSKPVQWMKDVRIRHHVTNLYLSVCIRQSKRRPLRSMDSSGLADALDNGGNKIGLMYDCELVSHADLTDRSIFRMVPTDSQNEEVPKTSVSFRLEHIEPTSGRTLHMTSARKVKYSETAWYQQKSLDIAFTPVKGDNDAFLVIPFETAHIIHKMDDLTAIMPFLSWFANDRLQQIDGCISKLRSSDISKCETVINKVISMMKDKSSAGERSEGDDDDLASCEISTAHLDETSQNFSRELKIMDFIFVVATIPFAFKLNTTFDSKSASFLDKDFSRVSDLVMLAWRALQSIFLNNKENEDYFARQENWITTTISLISDPIGAAVAFSKLISNNADLLKRYVSRSIIEEFKGLIKTKGLQSRLLSFFVSICTCQNKPIVSNQEAVLSQIWLDDDFRDHILFKMVENEDGNRTKLWESKADERTFPPDFLGQECVASGFKEILLDWRSIDQLKNFKIKGERICAVEELCWVLEPEALCERVTGSVWSEFKKSLDPILDSQGNIVGNSDAYVSFNQQWDLANYFKVQCDLFASMCHGRSYASIFSLSEAIPYTMLCIMINSRNLPSSIRESCVKVVHRLYVDRYPHSHHCGRPSLPDLVWKFDSLKKIKLSTSGKEEVVRVAQDHLAAMPFLFVTTYPSSPIRDAISSP